MQLYQPFGVALFVLFCSLVVSNEAKLSRNQIRRILLKKGKECDDDGRSDEYIMKFFDLRVKSLEGRCLIACTMDKLDMITWDGQFDTEGAIAFADKIQGSTPSGATRMADVFVEQCKDTTGKTACYFGYNLYKCLSTVSKDFV